MQQDIRTDVIITATRKDICTGEVMITGIISIDHTLEKFITAEESTMNGEDTMDIASIIIIGNLSKPLT